MLIPKELESVGWKIRGIVLSWFVVCNFLLFLKQMLIANLSPLIGQKNATQLILKILITLSQLILEQYGIGTYSAFIIGLLYFSQNSRKF